MALHPPFAPAALASLGPWLNLLFTHALHAALWAGVAVLLARRQSFSFAQQNGLWKAALLGPLLTTSLATALACDAKLEPVSHFASGSARPFGFVLSAVTTQTARFALEWRSIALVCAACGALGLLRFGLTALRLRRRCAARRLVGDARWLAELQSLQARSRVSSVCLSQSETLTGPLVLGMREICVPSALLDRLDETEIASVLAHELAHLERRDGIWFALVGLLGSLCWWQPHTRAVCARFRHSAELACDDRAVELTRDPRGLARALLHVAESALGAGQGAWLPAVVRSRSTLVARVERLAQRRASEVGEGGGVRWSLPVLALTGLASTFLSVDLARAEQPQIPPVHASLRANRADALEQEMHALGRREHEIMATLQTENSRSALDPASSSASVRVLELEQELSHVRSAQLWTEERMLEAGRSR